MTDLLSAKSRMRLAFAPLAAVIVFGTAAAPASAATTPPSVMVFDQELREKAVLIDYVYMPDDGFLAVYATDENGKSTGKLVGKMQLEAGDHRSLRLTLDEAVTPGDALWVSLYKDADANQSFDPGGGDIAYWQDGPLPAPNKFLVKGNANAA